MPSARHPADPSTFQFVGSAPSPEVASAALRIVGQMRFRPGTVDRLPASTWLRVFLWLGRPSEFQGERGRIRGTTVSRPNGHMADVPLARVRPEEHGIAHDRSARFSFSPLRDGPWMAG